MMTSYTIGRATIEHQGNGTWLAYGQGLFGPRHGVFITEAEAIAWAEELNATCD